MAQQGSSAQQDGSSRLAAVLRPLALSPQAAVCRPLAETCRALYDRRDDVRRAVMAALFDGEPAALRATGPSLDWSRDDDRDDDAVRFDFSVVDAPARERANAAAARLGVRDLWSAVDLAAAAQRVFDEVSRPGGDWLADASRACPRLLDVARVVFHCECCTRTRDDRGDFLAHALRWPIDLDGLQRSYPSIGEILASLDDAAVTLQRADDVLLSYAVSHERFRCDFSTASTGRLRYASGATLGSLADLAGEASIDVVVALRLRLSRRFGGVVALPAMRFALRHASDDGAGLRWRAALADVAEPSWSERALSLFLPLGALRELLRETLALELDVLPRAAGDAGPADAEFRARSDVPRLGGCLAAIARAFIKDKMGSALALLADLFEALDADLAALAAPSNGGS